MKKFSGFKNEGSKIKSTLIGTALIFGLFFGISFIVSLIAYNTDNPTSNVKLLSLVSFLLSAAVSGFVNMKIMGGNEFKNPLFSSLIFLSAFFIASTIICGKITLGCIMNILCFLLVSVLFTFLGKRRGRKSYARKR